MPGSASGVTPTICFLIFSHLYHLHQTMNNNFQRRMSRLDRQWRAQRSVINIVNCRIPWINRILNVYCAFGISLEACLLQCTCIYSFLCCSTRVAFESESCVLGMLSLAWLTYELYDLWPIRDPCKSLSVLRVSLYCSALASQCSIAEMTWS